MRALAIFLVPAVFLFCSCSEKSDEVFYLDILSPLDMGAGIRLAALPAGSFMMGSALKPTYEIVVTPIGTYYVFNPERPLHAVSLGSFKISTTEITQEQYRAVMGVNPSQFSGFSNMPVEGVSWYDAAAFCNRLSLQAGLDSCYNLTTWECDFTRSGFRLPTEAEWEYACRAGVGLEYYAGAGVNDLGRAAWFVDNSRSITHSVAEKEPNAAELYDMLGNVWEWCNDYYGKYHCNSESDPRGIGSGYLRVIRGGSWASVAGECRSAFRKAAEPDARRSNTGFRVVCR